ncbi:MAG: prolyl oligopeptidase family serine peptidase [Sphingomonadaceae bacterium]
MQVIRPRTGALFLCLSSCLLWAPLALHAAPRPISEIDLMRFQWLGEVQLSSDGRTASYVQLNVDDKKEGYESSLWSVTLASGERRRLTQSGRDAAPRWSPDGKYLAFTRQLEKDGKPQPPQIWVLPMDGGEAVQLTRLPKGASNPRWSHDGRSIAFLSTSNPQDLQQAACEADAKRDKASCNPLRVSDVQVITRAVYRSNGSGYNDFSRPSHIWRVAFTPNGPAAAPQQLTQGSYNEREIVWSADDQRLFFLSSPTLEPYYERPRTTVYAVPAGGGNPAPVHQVEGSVNGLSLSPDGQQLAWYSVRNLPVQSHTRTNLWVAPVAGGTPRNLTVKYDWESGGGSAGDQSAPRAGGEVLPLWSADGKSITTVVAKQGRANLERIAVDGSAIEPLTSGDQTVVRYASNGQQLVAVISNPTELNELYQIGDGAPRRLTQVNQALFSELALTPPQDLWYTSFDGAKVHALVQTPPGFDPSKKYPLILNIHGGPHAAYGHTFFHEMQWMAAKGYIVLYPNPRGSTTYGEAFANVIQHRYPGDDYKDLMAGVDELVKRGWVDTKRMGVTGGSGGGLLTNWVIGHTDRFAAAVAQRDIANWADWWYTADFTFFQEDWFKHTPFDDPEDYRKRSPITYVKNVKTPTMFVLGDADSRTPAEAGGDQMFRALKYRKIPTAMVRFPGESHELSRAGKPWHRVERLQHIVNWFDIYLMGKTSNEYDLVPPAAPDLRSAR